MGELAELENHYLTETAAAPRLNQQEMRKAKVFLIDKFLNLGLHSSI
jgi:hypothetical protein